jgi:hypothetical protein
MAERLGSADGWRAFLSSHGSGFYSELARAQLAKLAAADLPKASAPAPKPQETTASKPPDLAPKAQATPTPKPEATAAKPQDAAPPKPQTPPAVKPQEAASPKPQDVAASKPSEPAAPKPQELAALEPPVVSRSAMPTEDLVCKRDRTRLAQLRSNPSADEVAKFRQEMGCESLRAQVDRLAESLGVQTAAAPTPQIQAPATAKASSETQDQVCDREAAELARLRADPQADQIARFAGGFICERLRAQVQRLAESFGVKIVAPPTSPAPGAAHGFTAPVAVASTPAGAAPKPEDSLKVVDTAGLCKQEADELARIRANPDRNAAQQFAQRMKCDGLKAQTARLLESLGN